LLLSAVLAGDIDRQRRAPVPSSNGAAARRLPANAGSVMLTAEERGCTLDKGIVFNILCKQINLMRVVMMMMMTK